MRVEEGQRELSEEEDEPHRVVLLVTHLDLGTTRRMSSD